MTDVVPPLPRRDFLLGGKAEIKHLNIRKEGPDESKVLMLDIKLEVLRVGGLFVRYFDDALAAFLWRDEGLMMAARNARLQPVGYAHEISGATVLIDGLSFAGAEVKRITMSPIDGGMLTVGCSVTLNSPTADDVAVIAKRVQDVVEVFIESKATDMFDGSGAAPAKNKTKAAKKAEADALKAPKVAAAALQSMALVDGTTISLEANPNTPLGALFAALKKELEAAGVEATPDPLLAHAAELVRKERRASITMVQRHLKMGYNRAARLLESLEAAGVVTAMDKNGGREVKPVVEVVATAGADVERGDAVALRSDVAWPFPGQVSPMSPADLGSMEAAALAHESRKAARVVEPPAP